MGYNVRVQPANITKRIEACLHQSHHFCCQILWPPPTAASTVLLSSSTTVATAHHLHKVVSTSGIKSHSKKPQIVFHNVVTLLLIVLTSAASVFKLKASLNHLPRPGSQNFSHENAHFLCDLIHDMTLLSGVTLLAHFPTIAKVFISLSCCMPDRENELNWRYCTPRGHS